MRAGGAAGGEDGWSSHGCSFLLVMAGWRAVGEVLGVAWVAGVLGWDEGPFAFAFDEGPAVVGFLGVVVAAQAVEEIEGGDVGFGVVEAVVVLEPGAGGAALGRAGRVEEVEGGALVGVGVASVVVDAGQGVGFGQDADDEGVVGGQVGLDDGDGDGAVAGDLAQLAVEGEAA